MQILLHDDQVPEPSAYLCLAVEGRGQFGGIYRDTEGILGIEIQSVDIPPRKLMRVTAGTDFPQIQLC